MSLQDRIPRNWQLSTLGSVCEIIAGQSPPSSTYRYSAEGLPFFQGKADFGKRHPVPKVWCVQPTKVARRGDILISVRAPVGPTNIADTDCCIGRGLAAIRPKLEIDRDYILRTLRFFEPDLAQRGSGSTFEAITVKDLIDFPIPIPPLPEQRRIAAILDKADSLREKRRQAIAKLDELLKSVFIEMFGDPVMNPRRLPTKPIGKFGTVMTGNTPPRSNPEFYGEEIEWIKSDNINTPFHILTSAEERLSKKGRNVARTVPAGSTLVTCIAGSHDCIGNAALTDREVAFNQQINAITPNESTNPYFLYTQILLAKRLIQRASTNSMKGMVNKSAFSEIPLLSPPKQEQENFRIWFQRFHSLFQNSHKALKKHEELFQSLQQRAFSGELFTEKIVSTPLLPEVAQHA